jgi:hypothetical protein
VSVPWRGRETGNSCYLVPAAHPLGLERPTAWTVVFTNPTKSMRGPSAEREGVHGPRLENADRDPVDGEGCSQSKQRDKERCLFREIVKKRRKELALHARLGMPSVIGLAVESPLAHRQMARLRPHRRRLSNAGDDGLNTSVD